MGIGTSISLLAGYSYARGPGNSPIAQGLFGGFTLGGSGLAIAIVPRLASALGWRAPFGSAIGVCLVALAVLAVVDDPQHTLASPTQRAPGHLIADPRLVKLAGIHSVSMGFSVTAANWIVPFLVRSGLDLAPAGLVGSLAIIGSVVSRPIGGWLEAKHQVRAKGFLSASLGVGCLSTLLLAVSHSVVALTLGCALLGLAAGLPFAAVFTRAASGRPDAPGAAVAFVNMCGTLTVVVGVPLLGQAFAFESGARWSFLFLAVLWGIGLLVLSYPACPAKEA